MFVKDESTIKRENSYLKYEPGESGNELMIQSNLYRVAFHYLPTERMSVACHPTDCFYCAKGFRKNTEYNYWVYLNGQNGAMNIKANVFFDIQRIATAQKKDARAVSWTVVVSGQGRETKYSTSKNDNLAAEDYKKVTDTLEANNTKLQTLMTTHEATLEKNYSDIKAKMVGEPATEEEVSADDIPF
jgi:hypothetical protein